MSELLAEFRNCSVGYSQTPIFKDLNLKIRGGEFIAVIGPNGSGKTTLLKTLLGFLPLSKGDVLLLGKPPKHIEKHAVGYVPQHAELNLNLPLTGYEFLALKGTHTLSDDMKAILGQNFDELLNTPMQRLSIGQRQRIVLVFSLSQNPKLICLDEATDGLDFKSQNELFAILKKIQTESEISILLVSHDISAVGNYANRVICLDRALLFDGDPKSSEFHSCLHSIYGKDSFIHNHHHNH